MSHLPTALDTQLSEKDVEAARKAVLEASAKGQRKTGFATIPLPPRLTEAQKAEFLTSQMLYENMEWGKLVPVLLEMKEWRVKVPKEVESRLLLCNMMLATQTETASSYRDAVKQLKLDASNGDLYIGMALLKLGEYNVVDCASLLALAELCMTYHPNGLRLAHDKLRLLKATFGLQVFKVHKNVRTPDDVQWFKDTYPEVKESSHEVDEAVREWHSSSHLERFRLVSNWIRTPYLSTFAIEDRQIDPSKLKNDSALLRMPDNVFAKIMEFAGERVLLNVAETSVLGFQRVDYSPVWLHFASVAFGVSIQQMYACRLAGLLGSLDSDGRFDQWRWYLQQLPVLKSLEHAHLWDISTFELLLTQTRVIMEEPGSIQACTLPLDHTLYIFIMSITSPSTPAFVTQWMVTNSNFHLTLARLALTAREPVSNYIIAHLQLLLNSGASDATKWTQELIDAGLANALLIRTGKSDNYTAASGLLAHLKFHHLYGATSVDRAYQGELARLLDSEDVDEEKETLLNLASGVFHLAGYRIRDADSSSNDLFFASFQVEPRSVNLMLGAEAAEWDEDALDGEWALPLPDGLDEANTLKLIGHGRYIDSKGEVSLVELKATILVGSNGLLFQATLGGDARLSLNGFLAEPGFTGDITYWDDDMEDPEFCTSTPGGVFSFWKSSLPDTEANWSEVHVRDLDELHKLRTSGGYERERKARTRETFLQPNFLSVAAEGMDLARKFLLENLDLHIYSCLSRHSDDCMLLQELADGIEDSGQDLSHALPRGPYETDALYTNRAAGFFAIEEDKLPELRLVTSIALRSQHSFNELITLWTAWTRLFAAFQRDEIAKDGRTIAEHLRILYLYDPSGALLSTKASESFEVLKDLQKRFGHSPIPEEVAEQVREPMSWICGFMRTLHYQRMLSSLAHPVKAALSAQILLEWMMDAEEANRPVDDSIQVSAADNESSPLCKAIVAEYERLDSANDLVKLHRKWSIRFFAARPFLDPTGGRFLELLTSGTCSSFFPQVAEEEEQATAEDDAELLHRIGDDSDSDSDSDLDSSVTRYKSPLGISTPVLVAIGAVTASVCLTAFAVGRWLTHRH